MDATLGKTFKKNVIYAFFAQIVSLLSSFLVSFLVPKVLGVNDFSFWQLFLFYVSYINISRLGLIDGMYLRLGGKRKEELDTSLLKTEFFIFLIFQLIIAFMIMSFSNSLIDDENRLFVFFWCSICLIIINCNNYFGFIFQAINMTKIYSISEVIYNLLWFAAVIIVCLYDYKSYKIIIIFYTLGQILAGIYLLYKSRYIFKVQGARLKFALADCIENIKIGSSLLIAFYASMLIIGSARFIIDHKWGIAVFGVFSFSLSLSTFLLKFISQLSMVLFPSIRKLNEKDQYTFYQIVNNIFSIILPAFLLLYLPLSFVIGWWLPQYNDSLFYLGVLLPICIYDGKMQLLYSTYMKVVRYEKQLLLVNVIAMITCMTLSSFNAFILKSLEGVAISIVFAISLRSIISEIILSYKLDYKIDLLLMISENLIIIIFIYLNIYFNATISFFLYLIIYCMFLILNKKNVLKIYVYFMKKAKNRRKVEFL